MNEDKKTYWKSYEELLEDPQYLESAKHEFAEGIVDGGEDFLTMTRRKFLGLLGASVALATTSCRKPIHKILPYIKYPEMTGPGLTQFYASTFSHNNDAYGILVKTKDGRPIKIEGNPDHPLSLGAAGTHAQASVLELYDPDRKKKPTIDHKIATWKYLDSRVTAILKEAKTIRLLTESTTSPTLRSTYQKFVQSFPNAKWFEYEPLSQEQERDALWEAFGHRSVPKLHLDQAETIVSFNSDFMGHEPHSLIHTREWSSKRKIRSPKDSMSRLYVIESHFSTTGANADHRLPVRPSELLPIALDLARILALDLNVATDSDIKALLSHVPTTSGERQKLLQATAKDLLKNKGRSLILVGSQESVRLQVVGHLLNSMLGNFGTTLDTRVSTPSFNNGYNSLKPLLTELKAQSVDVLITIGGNPVYHLPELQESFELVLHRIRLSLHNDETEALSQYGVPLSHSLESWGDSEAQDGLFSLQQPTIRPLYTSRVAGEALLTWLAQIQGKEVDATGEWLKEIKSFWNSSVYAKENTIVPFESFWEGALHDGVVMRHVSTPKSFSFKSAALKKSVQLAIESVRAARSDVLELEIHPNYALYDGRYANNGWLQELPDPITKNTWDNVACLSPKTAQNLRVQHGDVIEISVNNKKIQLPVYLQPGLSQNVITTSLGYGRTAAGDVGTGIGENLFIFGQGFVWNHIEVRKTGKERKLATTQGHHSMEGRPIVREATLAEYKQHPDFPKHAVHYEKLSLYPEHEYKGHKWGMAIDLNTCVGCSGCVIACASENNTPVVGKTQVIKGREMNWLRIDRYYEGSDENPNVVHQPMLCQQCGNAPCENVCPVAATTHSPEGLNDMAYNRCVGTRYCSNNCPYKVRRFNFLNFNAYIETPQELGKNPDVTIRSRGVMEKCTFCVQRINEGKINARMKGYDRVSDGDIKTACQQACPTDAIVFGDLNDPTSEVSKLSKLTHGYGVLEELNTRPSITYLARVRNPNPSLEKESPHA